ncbi:MAG TPA: CNNM domain-containing protein [Chthoniobacterales bacterium]|nr:CNNM domain-containing protein [Chthoniobacterales bacterium]
MNWLFFLLCLAVSFLFSGTEAGLLSLNRLRLRHLTRLRDPAAIRLERLLREPTRLLVTVLFVTSLSNIAAVLILVSQLVGQWGSVGYVLALIVAFPVFLFFTEVFPKSLFRRFPYQALASVALILELASGLLTPLMKFGSWIGRKVFRLPRPREIFLAREDLKYVTSYVERMGLLSSIERQMIHNVVDFRLVKVRDVMVKMEKVYAVSGDMPLEEVIRLSRETKFDRFPVVSEKGIVGLVNALDLIVDQRPDATVQSYIRRILTVREDDPASAALRRLRAAPQGLAAVRNAAEDDVGIVSIEDLLNPLVGGALRV